MKHGLVAERVVMEVVPLLITLLTPQVQKLRKFLLPLPPAWLPV